MDRKTQDLVIFLLIGLVAGYIAHVLLGGSGGLIRYLVSGLLGAIVGPALLGMLNVNLRFGSQLASRIVAAAIGAVIVVIVARFIG